MHAPSVLFQKVTRRLRQPVRGLAAVGAGKEQHVVDDGAQPLQFFQLGLRRFLQFATTAFTGQRHLGRADQVADGRAQFMGDIGIEAFQSDISGFDLVERSA